MKFESSHLKIKWAYRHIQELETAFQAFLQTDFCRVVIEADEKTGNQFVRVVSVDSSPPEISLIIGDAAHNLRSALDHMMVKILGETPNLGIGANQFAFPMAKNRDNPGSHVAYGAIKKALPNLALLLTDTVGIHDTGEPCLWAISALDNADKHSLLIPTISVQELRNFSVEDKANGSQFSNMTARIGQGGVANLIQYGVPGGKLEITSKGQTAAAILFGKGQPLEGKPIIESLTKLAEITSQTVKTLELFWFGERKEG